MNMMEGEPARLSLHFVLLSALMGSEIFFNPCHSYRHDLSRLYDNSTYDRYSCRRFNTHKNKEVRSHCGTHLPLLDINQMD